MIAGATLNYNNSEVELISLIEEKIPKYKLRIDTITEFTGYQHNDWLIETPLIDLDAPIDVNPHILRETLNFFILSGKRLSQMTRVYNDIDALTKLLEEKERDLELAARIGQTLLDQNQGQNERINELENELSQAKDKIIQLKHEISSKKDLLQIYLKDEEDEDEEFFCSLSEDSPSIRSPNRAAQLLTQLEKRVGTLETENQKLKSETISRSSELEDEERKELQLIDECARRLSATNKQVALLQEEITRKNEENIRLQSDISNLSSQVTSLERRIRQLTAENEELESALSLAHECQSELSIELIDVKEKQANLLIAFHEKQEECRQLAKRNSLTDQLFPYVDSLAYELEQSSLSGAISHLDICDDTPFPALDASYHHHHHHQCTTPDSLLSNDSFYTSSPFTSFSGPSTSVNSNDLHKSQSSPGATSTNTNEASSSTDSNSTSTATTVVTAASRAIHRHHHFMTDKLRYIKPIKGSQILNHWRQLASPNLNNLNLFEDKEKYISRIKANLAASEAAISALSRDCKPSTASSGTRVDTRTVPSNSGVRVPLANNFVTTNSVFTFTTTSLSQTKESVTHVTSTFSNVQPSTGKGDFSLDLHSTQPSTARRDSLQSIRNVAHMCALTTQSTASQARTDSVDGSRTARSDSNRLTKKPSNVDPSGCSSQLKLEPLSGLNELSKLLEKDSLGLFSSALRPLNPNRRIMTKVMANANDLVGLSTDFFRTDLSVLRNLRKGGLI